MPGIGRQKAGKVTKAGQVAKAAKSAPGTKAGKPAQAASRSQPRRTKKAARHHARVVVVRASQMSWCAGHCRARLVLPGSGRQAEWVVMVHTRNADGTYADTLVYHEACYTRSGVDLYGPPVVDPRSSR